MSRRVKDTAISGLRGVVSAMGTCLPSGSMSGSSRTSRSHTKRGDPLSDLAKSNQSITHVEVIGDEAGVAEVDTRYEHKEIDSFLRLYSFIKREKLPWWSKMPFWMRDAMKNWLPPEAFKNREEALKSEKLSRDELDRQTEGSFSMAWGVFKQICVFISHSNVFVCFMLLTIVLNGIFMAFMVDSKDMSTSTKDGIDSTFIAIFVIESIIRVMAYNSYEHQHTGLILFEVLIVFIAVVDKWIIPALVATHHQIDLSVLTVFRVGRILQSVRMLQVFSFMRSMRTMERAVSRTVLYFFWNFVFLVCMSYIFALGFRIYLTRLDDPEPNYGMQIDYLGSTVDALIYFVEAVFKGMPWHPSMYEPLWQNNDTKAAGIILFVFIVCFDLAIVVLIKASFIENFFESGFRERVDVNRDIIVSKLDIPGLVGILENCDEKGDGRITLHEFLGPLQSTNAQRRKKYRKIFGLQRKDLEKEDIHLQRAERYLTAFFQAMDFAHEGSVSIDQILWGYIKLCGSECDVDDIVKDYSLQILLKLLRNPDRDFRFLSERLDKVETQLFFETTVAERFFQGQMDDQIRPFEEALGRLEQTFGDVSASLLHSEDLDKITEEAELPPGAAGVASLRLRAEMEALKKAATEFLAETEDEELPAPSPWWELHGDQLLM